MELCQKKEAKLINSRQSNKFYKNYEITSPVRVYPHWPVDPDLLAPPVREVDHEDEAQAEVGEVGRGGGCVAGGGGGGEAEVADLGGGEVGGGGEAGA